MPRSSLKQKDIIGLIRRIDLLRLSLALTNNKLYTTLAPRLIHARVVAQEMRDALAAYGST